VIRVDTALFAAAQAGDPVALERMLRELQPDIRRYARRQCHRTTAIEDVVQEALIVLYRREVILLRDMEQLTITEAADRLRITREACKSRIHRGRALMREYLQGDESRGGRK
jgi:DNA-directed RNA polymerase specialized sigma24 family protein